MYRWDARRPVRRRYLGSGARDALTMKRFFHQVSDWSMPHALFSNATTAWAIACVGCHALSVEFSNLYSKGKFVQDGRFDADAVSRQCGAALMLKAVAAAAPRTIRRRRTRR